MLFIHEMGHIIIAKCYNYKISEISIFPFGFYARILNLDYGRSLEVFMILFGGLSMHFLFYYIILFIYHLDMISVSFCEYLININKSIFIFNMIPIYPLDGGRLLFIFLRLFLNYRLSKIIIYIFSISFTLILLKYANLSLMIVLILLIILIVKDILCLNLQLVENIYYKEKDFND